MRRSSLRFCIVGTPAHPAAGFELQLQCDAGACETAHDRPYRHTYDFGSLLVAESINRHEQQGRALIGRQAADGPPNLIEGEPSFDPPHRLIRAHPFFGNLATLLADVPRADLIDPDRLHDAKHPTIEPRALLKLMLACEGAFACRLDQCLSIDWRPGEAARKAPQPRQSRDQLIAETDAYRFLARHQLYRRSRQILTERQRTSRRNIPVTPAPLISV